MIGARGTAEDFYVVLTMDCEPALFECSPAAIKLSGSGPEDYEQGERSMRGYFETAREYGFPVTFFAHPEVAEAQPGLLLELQGEGACLGMHLHPYKLRSRRWHRDLGSYSADEQLELVSEATKLWSDAIGQHPGYFRGGVFSANDATFRVLVDLGFKGGSVSCPGRVLPSAFAVWAGAELYPHRAHLGFRQAVGSSDFVEVPISVDVSRPTDMGDRHEIGFEWPYVPSRRYDLAAVVRNLLRRAAEENPPFPSLVTNTHQDQDYADAQHPSSRKLNVILETLRETSSSLGLRLVGSDLADMRTRLLEATEGSESNASGEPLRPWWAGPAK